MMKTRTNGMAARIEPAGAADGSAVAAFLSGGIGAFAVGLVVILNEAHLFAAPALYGPAGGVSGRTTLAMIAWLVVWGVLHHRWKGRDIPTHRIYPVTLVLIGLGVLATFPPVWRLF
jgi:hypothetical protein